MVFVHSPHVQSVHNRLIEIQFDGQETTVKTEKSITFLMKNGRHVSSIVILNYISETNNALIVLSYLYLLYLLCYTVLYMTTIATIILKSLTLHPLLLSH